MTKHEVAMPRLIDADKLKMCIKALAKDIARANGGVDDVTVALKEVYDMVDDAETIDAEPVRHGRWEWRENWGAGFQDPSEILDAGWACSACGTDLLPYLQSHFPDIPSYLECASEEEPTLERCPFCSAKMDGGKTDEEK